MGNHAAGNAIGLACQKAWKSKTKDQSALSILDEICEPFRGCDAEFESSDPKNPNRVHPESDDWRDPHPSMGLGMLMIEAFAPNGLDDLPKYTSGNKEADEEAIEIAYDLWESEVEEKFKQRYEFC